MALSQKGAGYDYRDKIKDQFTKGSLDHLASKIQAIETQGNFSSRGVPTPPSSPTAINVTAVNGLRTVNIVHPNPVSGLRWHLQYSTNPSFMNAVTVDLGESTTHEIYRPAGMIYIRAAAKFIASDRSQWIYFGSAASPTPV